MWWRRAEESNLHPGLSRSAGFRDQKALPSLRALRWSESRDSNPVRTVLRTVASTASASPTWLTREELNPESQFWRLLPSPSGRPCSKFGGDGRSRTYGVFPAGVTALQAVAVATVPHLQLSKNTIAKQMAEGGRVERPRPEGAPV